MSGPGVGRGVGIGGFRHILMPKTNTLVHICELCGANLKYVGLLLTYSDCSG